MTATQTKVGIDLDRIRAAIEPVLSAHGVTLVDLLWTTERAGWTLRVTIERLGAGPVDPGAIPADSGVSLADCAEVSRDVSALLDAEDLIAPHYYLEVSSPGLDRPLRTAADFIRFQGHSARVKLSRPAPDGQRVLRGVVEKADAGTIAMIVDGKRIEAPLADVAEANLVFELERQPKKNVSRGKRPSGPSAQRSASAERRWK